jgi:hypothetical protein
VKECESVRSLGDEGANGCRTVDRGIEIVSGPTIEAVELPDWWVWWADQATQIVHGADRFERAGHDLASSRFLGVV